MRCLMRVEDCPPGEYRRTLYFDMCVCVCVCVCVHARVYSITLTSCEHSQTHATADKPWLLSSRKELAEDREELQQWKDKLASAGPPFKFPESDTYVAKLAW